VPVHLREIDKEIPDVMYEPELLDPATEEHLKPKLFEASLGEVDRESLRRAANAAGVGRAEMGR
jgi:hypothetical protein